MTDIVKFTAEETQGISSVLSAGNTSVERATAATQALIAKLADGPMNDQKDQEANNLLVRLRETHDKINGQRSPFTKKMDEIKKLFTTQEAAIKSLSAQVQAYRDEWARQKAEEARKKEAEIRRKQNAEIERIELQAAAEVKLRSEYAAALASDKQYMLDIFNGLTLDAWDAGVKALADVSSVFMHDRWQAIQVIPVQPKFLNREEIDLLVVNVKTGKYDKAAASYKEHIEALRSELMDKLPSKKAELEAIAAAGAKERKRLEAEAAQREAAEKKRLEEEAAADAKRAAEEAEANKQISMAGAMFDGATAMAEVRGGQEGSKSIESYSITVKNPAGWMEIAALWFKEEGVKSDVSKMEKKTLGSMKTFAERWAKKTGETIDSKNLEYEAKYKAVNRKEAA